jgi:hypothetical protein
MKQRVFVVAWRNFARYLHQPEGGELEAVGDDTLGIVRHVRSVVTGESLDCSQSPNRQKGLGDSATIHVIKAT